MQRKFALLGPAIMLALSLVLVMAAPPRIGQKAPDFSLQEANGRMTSLAAILRENRVTLINFWATWCPPCRREIPELVAFHRAYQARGVQLLAIDIRENGSMVQRFAKERGMRFPVLLDRWGRVSDIYGVYAIPTTFVLDGRGIIKAKIEGGTTLRFLRAEVEPLLKKQ